MSVIYKKPILRGQKVKSYHDDQPDVWQLQCEHIAQDQEVRQMSPCGEKNEVLKWGVWWREEVEREVRREW